VGGAGAPGPIAAAVSPVGLAISIRHNGCVGQRL